MHWKPIGYMLPDNWENWMRFSSCDLGDKEMGGVFPRACPVKNIAYYLLSKG